MLNIGEPAGRAAGDVINDIAAALAGEHGLPDRLHIPVRGRHAAAAQCLRPASVAALVLSIVLIYMLLVALYQSWLAPLSIMFALPVTLVGAFGGLWLTGRTLNIISLLGVILLTGIVTKNAILIVDFTDQLHRRRG